jgi:hypothetical protein
MTVRDLLTALQTLPRDAESLAFEAGWRITASARSMIISGRRQDLQHVQHKFL